MKIIIMVFTAIACIFSITLSFSKPLSKHMEHPIIAQYFGIFIGGNQTWEQKFRTDTPFDKLNRLYIAFGKIIKTNDGHFSIAFDGEPKYAQAIIQRMQTVNPNADVFISIGGDGSPGSFGGAANDTKFATNVLNFLRQYDCKGVDIDWETGLDRKNLNQLVTRLGTTLHKYHKKLTLAGWAGISDAYDMRVLSSNLDNINIMSYGTGQPLETSVTQYIKAGFPAEMIIGGIETETHYHDFGGATDTLGQDGTIRQKANYALTYHLAGMMEWRLDNDYALLDNLNYPTYKGALELWSAMNK